MFDSVPFALLITEGVHDVNALIRILTIKGYRELQSANEVPGSLSVLIPRHYPLGKERQLNRIVPHPAFLEKDGSYLVISNANGESRLGSNLSYLIELLRDEERESLQCIAIVADTDTYTVETRQSEIMDQIRSSMEPVPTINMASPQSGELIYNNQNIPLYMFLFPNNREQGTLETVLLLGADAKYPDLLREATKYIDFAKVSYPDRLTQSAPQKATVGVISNVLRPGAANHISIRHDEWFTEESIRTIPYHTDLSSFLDMLCAAVGTVSEACAADNIVSQSVQ